MKKFKVFLMFLFVSITLANYINLNSMNTTNNNSYQKGSEENNFSPSLAQDFELIQDFEASTYFISPESSKGNYDGVLFSFMGNKNGNYTIEIVNYPNFLTYNQFGEDYISFDNPNGSDSWYIAYVERNENNLGPHNIKMLSSEDKGKSWNNKIIKSINPNIQNPEDYFYYVSGSAIAADPKTGYIIIATWINTTYLACLRSFDHGITWSGPDYIYNSIELGTENLLGYGYHPRIDVGIMKNGSTVIISEADNENFTKLVYIESSDQGDSWNPPKNVSCTVGSNAKIPKIQVDHNSGKYWLMWKDYRPGIGNDDKTIWAEFSPNQILFNKTVQNQTVLDYDTYGSYDFYYDTANDLFRMIYLDTYFTDLVLENWTCDDFSSNNWQRTILEELDGLGALASPNNYINYIYSNNDQIFFKGSFLGNIDVYQYKFLRNNLFWKNKGFFFENELKQIFWNGNKSDGTPVENSMVKVIFTENYTMEEKDLFIIIDNINPEIVEFDQKKHFFNPLSTNLSLTYIPWEILPSESCNAFLQIFSEQTAISSWSQVVENNWEDQGPKIFISNTNILYILYNSLEAGRNIIYLIKSYDMGITWSNPVEIYDSSGNIQDFRGTAWNDAVFIYIQSNFNKRDIYRSFDQGESFQDPINIYHPSLFPNSVVSISDIITTNNGTMFLTYKYQTYQDTPNYTILRSDYFGTNWTISKKFIGNASFDTSLQPDLGYDPIHDLVHFVMPMDNRTTNPIINFSFSTFNLYNDEWSPLKSIGIFEAGNFIQDPKFIITRDNLTAQPKARLIYINDLEFPELAFSYKQIVSEDFGANWLDPSDVEMDYFEGITSNLEEIFYILVNTDGNDGELFFRREGKLIHTERSSLSSINQAEISFDGFNDFGDYIDEGNYTYRIELIDYAGNSIMETGWFYADYIAPNITEHFTNYNIPPIPRNDLIITVNITENTNCTTYLYYKKDGASWQAVLMNPIGNGYHTGTIPGDSKTHQIQYYIKSTDLAGNEFILDNYGDYYSYSMPSFSWDSDGLFKESKSYSSSQDYEITIKIESDLEYVDEVIFRYSYDEGDKWEDLELKQSSPEFSGELDDIPGDLRTLYYKVIVIDIYGNEHELTDTREVEFYPEVPSVSFEQGDITLIIIISAIVGIVVGIGYIKLKSTSHETIYKQIFLKDYAKKIEKAKKLSDDTISKTVLSRFKKEPIETQLESPQGISSSTPFTKVYLGILCGTVSVFSIALLFSVFAPAVGMLILATSLLMGVFGYMILMSRDITLNIYLERIFLKNIALEVFQIFFMFINIVAILLVGFTIDWFRYYLIESTYNIGSTSIPRLYFSIFAVFFTSLVLVGITTYIQLKKTVKNLQHQSSQGASSNLLLYLKDQNASRLITRLGYKTVIFLVTILLAVLTTTNLLTEETGIALLIIIIPFTIASFLTMMVHRFFEMKSNERKKEDIQLPFSDSKKFCSKCGKEMYLSNKFCGSCGSQQIYEDMFGTYVSRCINCNALVNEKAQFCTECGKKIQTITKMKN